MPLAALPIARPDFNRRRRRRIFLLPPFKINTAGTPHRRITEDIFKCTAPPSPTRHRVFPCPTVLSLLCCGEPTCGIELDRTKLYTAIRIGKSLFHSHPFEKSRFQCLIFRIKKKVISSLKRKEIIVTKLYKQDIFKCTVLSLLRCVKWWNCRAMRIEKSLFHSHPRENRRFQCRKKKKIILQSERKLSLQSYYRRHF